MCQYRCRIRVYVTASQGESHKKRRKYNELGGIKNPSCQGKRNKQIKINNATKLLNLSANLLVYY